MGEPLAFENGEPCPGRVAQHVVGRIVAVELVPYARPVRIGCAPAPEEYAPIGRTGEVVYRVAVGRHALPALPADLRPALLGEWLGEDDEGVDGQDLAG